MLMWRWTQFFPLLKSPPLTSRVRPLCRYKTADDVFDDAFLATVIFHGASEDDVELAEEAQAYLAKLGIKQVIFLALPELLPRLYALVGNELRDVWKLVDDADETYMATLKPQSK